jgi:hypothetical protein
MMSSKRAANPRAPAPHRCARGQRNITRPLPARAAHPRRAAADDTAPISLGGNVVCSREGSERLAAPAQRADQSVCAHQVRASAGRLATSPIAAFLLLQHGLLLQLSWAETLTKDHALRLRRTTGCGTIQLAGDRDFSAVYILVYESDRCTHVVLSG